jgi:hypothetical protein
MNVIKKKLAVAVLGFVPLMLPASRAIAGGCHTENRTVPGPSSQDIVTMSCQHNAVAPTTGLAAVNVNGGGDRTLSANLTAGVSIRVDGLDSSGNVVGTCTRTDTTVNGSAVSTSIGECGATVVKWSGFVVYNE